MISRITMKLSDSLDWVRLAVQNCKNDVAIAMLDELIPQVRAIEVPGGPLGLKEEEPHEDDKRTT